MQLGDQLIRKIDGKLYQVEKIDLSGTYTLYIIKSNTSVIQLTVTKYELESQYYLPLPLHPTTLENKRAPKSKHKFPATNRVNTLEK